MGFHVLRYATDLTANHEKKKMERIVALHEVHCHSRHGVGWAAAGGVKPLFSSRAAIRPWPVAVE